MHVLLVSARAACARARTRTPANVCACAPVPAPMRACLCLRPCVRAACCVPRARVRARLVAALCEELSVWRQHGGNDRLDQRRGEGLGRQLEEG
eukprot:1717660-Pleurochrysis_carterae.AAC.1